MDFFNIPKLIEQGVYDVMMWILFFPLTVLRMIVSPRRTLRYVREQAALDPDTAFSDAMRPALFLAIALILGIPILIEFFNTGLVPRFPTLIVAAIFVVLAILFFITGIILEVIVKKHKQLFELYLNKLGKRP